MRKKVNLFLDLKRMLLKTHYLDRFFFSSPFVCDLQRETFILISLKSLVMSFTIEPEFRSHELHRFFKSIP